MSLDNVGRGDLHHLAVGNVPKQCRYARVPPGGKFVEFSNLLAKTAMRPSVLRAGIERAAQPFVAALSSIDRRFLRARTTLRAAPLMA
jgi:hypothetical protein